MQELKVTFTPDDGGPPRPITLRIGAPIGGPHSWSALVEILGFEDSHEEYSEGEDWAQALELAAQDLPFKLQLLVSIAGGGKIDPPFYRREPRDWT